MFEIFRVPDESAEFSEQMGTKFKFWYQDEQLGLTLFKEGRPGTGENWAEKITCELAQILGLPHAQYELAEWRDRAGIISPTFVPNDTRLIHGNELVGGKVTVASQDTKVRFYHEREHTASRVFQFLLQSSDYIMRPQNFQSFSGVGSALDTFVGYLMFDVWIANQDRHSENWGVIKHLNNVYLAPTYDHGSSLGRQETDERRNSMMTTKDKGASIEAYVRKARSAMYPNSPSNIKPKALLNLDLFIEVKKIAPVAAAAWLSRLEMISASDIKGIIERIPESHMSDVARDFTHKLLILNQERLLN